MDEFDSMTYMEASEIRNCMPNIAEYNVDNLWQFKLNAATFR